MLMFTSSRTKHKYDHFIFIDASGIGHQIDESKLLEHFYENGRLHLVFEDNEHVVHNEWRSIDYKYNKPQ